MAAAAPSSAEVIQLFRALLREAKNFPNYNIRKYMKRRVKEGFRENISTTDPAAVAAAMPMDVSASSSETVSSILTLCSPHQEHHGYKDHGRYIMILICP
ncbi:unnamed protein product [Calypogeia fissa]